MEATTYSARISAIQASNLQDKAKFEQELDQLLQKWEKKKEEVHDPDAKTADYFVTKLTTLSPDFTEEQFDQIIQFGKLKDEKRSYRRFIDMLIHHEEFNKYKKVLEIMFSADSSQYKNESLESREICQRIVCFLSNYEDYPWICQLLIKYDNFNALAKRLKGKM